MLPKRCQCRKQIHCAAMRRRKKDISMARLCLDSISISSLYSFTFAQHSNLAWHRNSCIKQEEKHAWTGGFRQSSTKKRATLVEVIPWKALILLNFSLAEAALEQALKRLAVARLVAGHLVHGIFFGHPQSNIEVSQYQASFEHLLYKFGTTSKHLSNRFWTTLVPL